MPWSLGGNHLSDDNDEKKDLTRIESLGEFLHDDEDDFSDLETYNPDAELGDDDDITDQATDPNLEFPPEFKVTPEDIQEFEDSNEAFSNYGEDESVDDFNSESNFDDSDNFENQESFDHIVEYEDEEEVNEVNEVEEVEAAEEDSFLPVEKSPLPNYEPPMPEYHQTTPTPADAAETIQNLQTFATNITYGDLTAEGNPPFSIVIKNLKYKEDAEDILILLKELKVIDPEGEDHARSSLLRGSMLIPRLSEYAAITICHKLRRYHLNLLMGLSDEIHPPRTKDGQTISKSSVYGDYSHSFDLGHGHMRPADVMTATTSGLEGFEIIKYLGVVSERTLVDMEHFSSDQSLELELIDQLGSEQRKNILRQNITRENRNAANSQPPMNFPEHEPKSTSTNLNLIEIYSDLAHKLKAHAITFKGNAVVGINYAVTPIVVSDNLNIQSKYQITCTGSVVWAAKK